MVALTTISIIGALGASVIPHEYVGLHPYIQINIEKYNHILVPIVFIGLGISILMESGTIR